MKLSIAKHDVLRIIVDADVFLKKCEIYRKFINNSSKIEIKSVLLCCLGGLRLGLYMDFLLVNTCLASYHVHDHIFSPLIIINTQWH